MELVITLVISFYSLFIIYIVGRLNRYLKLPLEERRAMTLSQRMMYLYGSYRAPKKDLQQTASSSLSTFQDAWHNMEEVFKQFETTFEKRRNDLQKAETNLTKLQEEVQEQNDRLKVFTQLTPEVANEVIQAIKMSSRNSLKQQVIISAVFFVLGSVTTLAITLSVV